MSPARAVDSLDATQVVGHVLSASAIVGALVGFFPAIATLAAFIWYVLQIYQSNTMQKYLRRRRARKIQVLKKMLAELERDHNGHHD